MHCCHTPGHSILSFPNKFDISSSAYAQAFYVLDTRTLIPIRGRKALPGPLLSRARENFQFLALNYQTEQVSFHTFQMTIERSLETGYRDGAWDITFPRL
jgi:hypothetical protein